MPLPLLFIAVAAATGLVGVGKSVKAGVDTHNANKTNEKANNIVNSANGRMEKARKECDSNLKNLGRTKLNILEYSINHFVNSFSKLKNVNFKPSAGLNEAGKLCIDSKDFDELKEMGGFATNILGGVASGAMGGALTAFGAYSAAGTFAAASTGTAIASLSGAAATNATLAFFGGGSLAAGGLGIAGGTMVLGGLVAGPALAIMGLVVGAKASKTRDEAYSNLAKAKKFSEEINLACDLCNGISKKCNMFITLLEKLDKKFVPLIKKIDKAILEHGNDYSTFSEEQKNATVAAASLAKAIKTVLDTAILDASGNLTKESSKVLKEIKPENFVEDNTKNVQTSFKHHVPSTRELSLNEIIYQCESYTYKKKRYYNGNSDDWEECSVIQWDKLRSLIADSFGIECTEEEYKLYVEDFGVLTPSWLSDLRSSLKKFIKTYQISFIVSECITTNDQLVDQDDVNWDLLVKHIKNLYKVDCNKWQLSHPGSNQVSDIIKRLCGTIQNKIEVGTKDTFTYSEFLRLLTK